MQITYTQFVFKVLSELASQMRWNMTVCPEGLQLRAGDDVCDTPSPNCLQGNDCEQRKLETEPFEIEILLGNSL